MTQMPFEMTLRNPYGYNFEKPRLNFIARFAFEPAKRFFCRQTLGLN